MNMPKPHNDRPAPPTRLQARRGSPAPEFPTAAPCSPGVGRIADQRARLPHSARGVGRTGGYGGCLPHTGRVQRWCGAKRRPGRWFVPVPAIVGEPVSTAAFQGGRLPHSHGIRPLCGANRRPARPFATHRAGCGTNRRPGRPSAPHRPGAALVWGESPVWRMVCRSARGGEPVCGAAFSSVRRAVAAGLDMGGRLSHSPAIRPLCGANRRPGRPFATHRAGEWDGPAARAAVCPTPACCGAGVGRNADLDAGAGCCSARGPGSLWGSAPRSARRT
jgi:hypothetical protein